MKKLIGQSHRMCPETGEPDRPPVHHAFGLLPLMHPLANRRFACGLAGTVFG